MSTNTLSSSSNNKQQQEEEEEDIKQANVQLMSSNEISSTMMLSIPAAIEPLPSSIEQVPAAQQTVSNHLDITLDTINTTPTLPISNDLSYQMLPLNDTTQQMLSTTTTTTTTHDSTTNPIYQEILLKINRLNQLWNNKQHEEENLKKKKI